MKKGGSDELKQIVKVGASVRKSEGDKMKQSMELGEEGGAINNSGR